MEPKINLFSLAGFALALCCLLLAVIIKSKLNFGTEVIIELPSARAGAPAG